VSDTCVRNLRLSWVELSRGIEPASAVLHYWLLISCINQNCQISFFNILCCVLWKCVLVHIFWFCSSRMLLWHGKRKEIKEESFWQSAWVSALTLLLTGLCSVLLFVQSHVANIIASVYTPGIRLIITRLHQKPWDTARKPSGSTDHNPRHKTIKNVISVTRKFLRLLHGRLVPGMEVGEENLAFFHHHWLN